MQAPSGIESWRVDDGWWVVAWMPVSGHPVRAWYSHPYESANTDQARTSPFPVPWGGSTLVKIANCGGHPGDPSCMSDTALVRVHSTGRLDITWDRGPDTRA